MAQSELFIAEFRADLRTAKRNIAMSCDSMALSLWLQPSLKSLLEETYPSDVRNHNSVSVFAAVGGLTAQTRPLAHRRPARHFDRLVVLLYLGC